MFNNGVVLHGQMRNTYFTGIRSQRQTIDIMIDLHQHLEQCLAFYLDLRVNMKSFIVYDPLDNDDCTLSVLEFLWLCSFPEAVRGGSPNVRIRL